MTDTNGVFIIGRLVKDAEIRYTSGSKMAIVNGAIAVNRSVKRGGQWEEESSFFDFDAFGSLAENLKPYLIKGKRIAISGYLKQDRWQDQEGVKHQKIYIGAQLIQLLDGGSTKGNPPVSAVDVSGADEIPF